MRKTLSQEHKKRISLAKKGSKLSVKHKIRISKSMKGRKLSEEHRAKLRLSMKGINTWTKGKTASEETRIKLRKRVFTEKHRENLRKSTFEYAKTVCGIICPRIGRNEKKILDSIEKEMCVKIQRQYECLGYFIDGYIPEMGIAIEVDEKPKKATKDIERESTLKKELNCRFIRIKDYD
jgi:hypothetical protein